MGHFAVMVIGDNPKDQLVPYKWGLTTNFGKWDSYVLGGRWRGFFRLKMNTSGILGDSLLNNSRSTNDVDQALKMNIDFEGMKNIAAHRAEIKYNEVEKLFGGTIPKLEITWSELTNNTISKYANLSIAEKRRVYNNQPANIHKENLKKRKNMSADQKDFITWESLDRYQISQSKFINNAHQLALFTHAYVIDGKWHDTAYEIGHLVWAERLSTIIDNVDDNTLISVYDCCF